MVLKKIKRRLAIEKAKRTGKTVVISKKEKKFEGGQSVTIESVNRDGQYCKVIKVYTHKKR